MILDWIRHRPRRSFKGALSVIVVIIHVVVAWCIIVARHHIRWQYELLLAVSTVLNDVALLIILRHSRHVTHTLIMAGIIVVPRLNLAMRVRTMAGSAELTILHLRMRQVTCLKSASDRRSLRELIFLLCLLLKLHLLWLS